MSLVQTLMNYLIDEIFGKEKIVNIKINGEIR